jgi:hypothetical protein
LGPSARKASFIRRKLLTRTKRELATPSPSQFALNLQRRFAELDQRLRGRYSDEQGDFEVSLVTYDEALRRLVVVDGLVNGETAGPSALDFFLPFGFGLAGAAYKQGRVYTYVRLPESFGSRDLEFYLPLSGGRHQVLGAFPISHPDYHDGLGIERSRQCVGLVDIGTTSNGKLLRQIFEDAPYISALCHSVLFERDVPPEPRLPIDLSPLRVEGMITPPEWTRHTLQTFSRWLPAQPDATSAERPEEIQGRKHKHATAGRNH